jgi:hypothetical protein
MASDLELVGSIKWVKWENYNVDGSITDQYSLNGIDWEDISYLESWTNTGSVKSTFVHRLQITGSNQETPYSQVRLAGIQVNNNFSVSLKPSERRDVC